jgi:membrane protease YdiL (CAAX protease family)
MNVLVSGLPGQQTFGDAMPDDNDFRKPDEETARPLSEPQAPETRFVPENEPEPPPDLAPGLPFETVPEAPPPRPPHPGFWWAVLWCLGILLVTQVLPGIVGLVIFILTSADGLSPEKLSDAQALLRSPQYAQAMLWAMLLAQILMVGTAWLVIRLVVGKKWPRFLALRWPSWSHVVLALMGLPGLIVIGMGVDGLAKQVLPSLFGLEQMMEMIGKWPWPLGVLIIGLGPGIGEELWFRGFFGRGLVARHGIVGGVLLTSLLFGLIHVEPRQAVYATVIGVLLHLSYLASRSLLVPILLHAANNSLSVLALHSPVLRAIDMPAEQIPWYVYGAAVLLVAAVGWAFFKSRPLFVDYPALDAAPWRPAFPGVAYPPAQAATRVVHRAPPGTVWLLAVVSLLAFAAAVVPVAVEASAKATQERKN